MFKGPEDSKHNHEPSLADREEAEATARFGRKRKRGRKRKSQPADPNYDVTKSDSNSGISAETAPRSFQSPEAVKELQVDEVIAKSKSNRPQRSSAQGKMYVFDDSDDSDVDIPNSSPTRLIGPRLCIDGFIYDRQCKSNISGKIHWERRGYIKHRCTGRAVTSDPSESAQLITYRGSEVSKHDHLSSRHEVEEAERNAKFWNTKDPKTCAAIRTTGRSSVKKDSRNSEKNEKSVQFVENVCPNESASQKEPPVSGTGNDSDVSSPMLIGKRLCIDGFFYSARSYYNTRTTWYCRNAQISTGMCLAKAVTSIPTEGEDLIVDKGPKESIHNHPPSLDELEEEKESASGGFKRAKRKMKSTIEIFNRNQDLAKARLPLNQNVKPNLKRSLVGGSESKGSALPRKRRKKVVSHEGSRGYGGGRSLLSDSFTYRCFLMRFLQNPIFDRKNVIEVLGSFYKSKIGCIMGYAMVLENREKIESDLEALKNNPSARIVTLDGINAIRTRKNRVPKNISRKKMTRRRKTKAASDSNSSSDEQCETVPEKNVGDETRNIPSGNCSREAEKSCHKEVHSARARDAEEMFKGVLIHPAFVSSEEQLSLSSSRPIVDSSEDEVEVGQEKDGSLFSENKADNGRISKLTSPASSVAITSKNQPLYSLSTSTTDSCEGEFEVGQEMEGSRLSSQSEPNSEQTLRITSPVLTAITNKDQPLPSPSISTIDSSDDGLEVEQEIEESPPTQEKINDEGIFKTIPPVPKALLITNINPQEATPTEDLNEREHEINREIPLVDLTDDFDVKHECPTHGEQILQESLQGPACSSKNTSTVSEIIDANGAPTTNPNLPDSPCAANPIIFKSQAPTQNQCIPSNIREIACDQNMHQILSSVPVNASFNAPYLIGEMQVPLRVNVPNAKNDAAPNEDQLYAQIKLFRQPASHRQNQEPKS